MDNTNINIPLLALKYGEALSKTKLYNPQTISILRLIDIDGEDKLLKELNKDIVEFCEDNPLHISRDFVYKNDYFTPRNMYLISPIYYLYYNKLVFDIAYNYSNGKKALDFSSDLLKTFYSGKLEFSLEDDDVTFNSNFNNSYKSFQNERENFFGHPALKIDLKDFFSSIKVINLIQKLKNHIGESKAIDDLLYFYSVCGFTSIPQFHYSIGSSILSQFYLLDFDGKIKKLLKDENLYLIRFVDDMFIIPEDKLNIERRNNDNLHLINHWLWQDELALNSNKTRVLSAEEYKTEFETMTEYQEESSYSNEKKIEDRADEIINNGNFKFVLLELHKLEKEEGVSLGEYKKLTDDFISIGGEDTYKIINNIVFSKKWEMLTDTDLMEILRKWKYVLFNPAQFTILYVMISRYLEEMKKGDGSPIYRLLNYLLRKDNFTFRETLVACAYLFQNRSKHAALLSKIEIINEDYVKFIKLHITN